MIRRLVEYIVNQIGLMLCVAAAVAVYAVLAVVLVYVLTLVKLAL